MTTERSVWTSKREMADRAWGMVLPMCECGRPLVHCAAAVSSCTKVHEHAA